MYKKAEIVIIHNRQIIRPLKEESQVGPGRNRREPESIHWAIARKLVTCEGLIQAVEAIGALDMSVVALIGDHPQLMYNF